MDNHEITMKGPFWTQNAAIGAWAATDEARILYDATGNLLYYGDDSAWNRITVGDPATFALKASDNNWTAHQTPGTTNTYDLGGSGDVWANVYATTFTGTVTTATYADLAEKYTAPIIYPKGTVVEVSDDENYDIRAVDGLSQHVIGVVSDSPGFLMNQDLVDGTIVGLVGRVPVRISGPIKKRDFIQPTSNGCAKSFNSEHTYHRIGIALESNDDPEEKLVECLLRL
jgi:hypothetical protein